MLLERQDGNGLNKVKSLGIPPKIMDEPWLKRPKELRREALAKEKEEATKKKELQQCDTCNPDISTVF